MNSFAKAMALLCGATAIAAQQLPGPGRQGVISRLLPDISTVADLVTDFSPKGSTQEAPCRFCLREIELALGAAVDPYFRGDVYVGVSDAEGVSLEVELARGTWSFRDSDGRELTRCESVSGEYEPRMPVNHSRARLSLLSPQRSAASLSRECR